mmetsp:Transcript_4873/g.12820  ORF Transcript_4873/g.12820 Transcript_4873/m.12820 type:complete len:533 (-) Transcript_4873:1454-3052(-)
MLPWSWPTSMKTRSSRRGRATAVAVAVAAAVVAAAPSASSLATASSDHRETLTIVITIENSHHNDSIIITIITGITSVKTHHITRQRNTNTNECNNQRTNENMMQSTTPRMLSQNFTPTRADVLCGRDQESYMHEGNRILRKIIKESIPSYVAAKSKVSKSHIVASIVRQIRNVNPNGGFVRKDLESRRWIEIGETKAKEKVGQAIRIEIRRSKTNSKKAFMKSSKTTTATTTPPTTASITSKNSSTMSQTSSPSVSSANSIVKPTDFESQTPIQSAMASLPIDPGFAMPTRHQSTRSMSAPTITSLSQFLGDDSLLLQPDPIDGPLTRVGSMYMPQQAKRNSAPDLSMSMSMNAVSGSRSNSTTTPAPLFDQDCQTFANDIFTDTTAPMKTPSFHPIDSIFQSLESFNNGSSVEASRSFEMFEAGAVGSSMDDALGNSNISNNNGAASTPHRIAPIDTMACMNTSVRAQCQNQRQTMQAASSQQPRSQQRQSQNQPMNAAERLADNCNVLSWQMNFTPMPLIGDIGDFDDL